VSNFWDRLGTAEPASNAPLAAPQPVANGPWWQAPQYAAQAPAAGPAAPQGTPNNITEALLATGPVPIKAQSARVTTTCPECGSGNYFRPSGQPNMVESCFECGYNARFSHSTAGAGMPGGESTGPATPSVQVGLGSGKQNNFNPGVFINK
jgi:hypothetical protein